MYWLLPWVKWTLPRYLCLGIGLGLVPIVAVSLWDDIKALRAGPKFIGHVIGAAIAVWFGVSLAGDVHLFGTTISIGFLAVPLSVVWIVGVTNAFNIVDGLDGLSAGLGLISSLSLAAMFLAGRADRHGRRGAGARWRARRVPAVQHPPSPYVPGRHRGDGRRVLPGRVRPQRLARRYQPASPRFFPCSCSASRSRKR